jgi:hypothetical protein
MSKKSLLAILFAGMRQKKLPKTKIADRNSQENGFISSKPKNKISWVSEDTYQFGCSSTSAGSIMPIQDRGEEYPSD